MAIVNITAKFKNKVQEVWDIVTSLEHYEWRSDISKIAIISEKQFIEYTKDGYATTFTVTDLKPCMRWEFDLENDNIKAHWVGIFKQEGEETEIEFIEDVTAKKIFMKPFVKAFLKKQQKQYIIDLKRELGT